MQSKELMAMGVVAIAGLLAGITVMNTNQASSQETTSTVTRDTVTVLLDHKVIPAKDFIHLYDTTPYIAMNGHVAAKLPCDANAETPLKIVMGVAPDVKPAEMELVEGLSSPGNMCIYHVDLPPEGIDAVTDVAILNPTDKAIRFPRTSTVTVSVNEIMPGEEMGGMEH